MEISTKKDLNSLPISEDLFENQIEIGLEKNLNSMPVGEDLLEN